MDMGYMGYERALARGAWRVTTCHVLLLGARQQTKWSGGRGLLTLSLAFTRYCHYQYCYILYGVWHTKEGSGGRRILRNRRAKVLQ